MGSSLEEKVQECACAPGVPQAWSPGRAGTAVGSSRGAEPLAGRRQEKPHWGFGGFSARVEALQPQVWTHSCGPRGQCLAAGPRAGLCLRSHTLARLASSPPAARRGGEVSAQKKHRFSFASAGRRRAAAAPSLGFCGSPCRGLTTSPVTRPQRRCCVSDCSLDTLRDHKHHPAGVGPGRSEGPAELHPSRMQWRHQDQAE